MRLITMAAAAICGLVSTLPSAAQDLLTEKKVFDLASFTTQSGRALKGVKVGYETYGTLNADKSNAILICHYFTGNSHAAGKYSAAEKVPGYWDAIIGPGKAIDTTKYFVISSDTLVNLAASDPLVTTTGPASTDPDTGKPYAMTFPIVTIHDLVEVEVKLVESFGIKKLAMVSGASMGALQTYDWAATHPEMVAKIMPVIGADEADAWLIEWLDIWAEPIRLDPNWKGGNYYGSEPPSKGLAAALKIVTLHAQHWEWADQTFGRKWAKEGEDPAKSFDNRYGIEAALNAAGAARAKTSDANHFLYLVKANQLFSVADALKKITMPVLLITQPKDLVFQKDSIALTLEHLKANGAPVQHVTLEGGRGHLDGVLSMKQAEKPIQEFLSK